MAFAQNFGYCLDQMGLSPYAFAQIIGVSNQGVLNWKIGISISTGLNSSEIPNSWCYAVVSSRSSRYNFRLPTGCRTCNWEWAWDAAGRSGCKHTKKQTPERVCFVYGKCLMLRRRTEV